MNHALGENGTGEGIRDRNGLGKALGVIQPSIVPSFCELDAKESRPKTGAIF